MKRLFTIVLMLMSVPLFAQEVPIIEQGPPSVPPPFMEPPMIILAPSMSNLKPIELVGYETSVRVTGFVCQTDITMTFYNPNARQLAGDLVFPLPEGVTVSGYALDIQGEMVDAVAVTKEKARVTLEKEMRRGADPGIVERQRGNQFKTRVFPLPSNGTRRIKIQYVTTAQFDVQKNCAIYRQPIALTKPVKNFALTVDVIRPTENPKLVSGDLGDLNFGSWQEGVRAEVKKENFQTNKELVLELPNVGETLALRSVTEKSEDGYTYFAIAVKTGTRDQGLGTREEEQKSSPQSPVPNPQLQVAVYWDCSGSRSQTGRAGEQVKETAFLTAWLKANNVESVRLIPIRNTIDTKEIQTVKTDDLISAITALPGDGATNLSAIASVAQKDELGLLFTDGFATWGDQTELKAVGRLFAFSSGTAVDSSYLKRITSANGGKYINLESLATEKAVEAFNTALTQPDATATIEAENAQAVPSQLDKTAPVAVHFICGRTDKASAIVKVNSTELKFEITTDDKTPHGETLRTMYAQTALADLELSPKENQKAIEELGKTFGLTTSETSLIVLENLNQYIEHDIEPPKTLAKMRTAFLEYKKNQEDKKETSLNEKKEKRLDYLRRLWSARTAWYDTKFEPTLWDKAKQVAGRVLGGETRNGIVAGAPMAQQRLMAAPPAPPVEVYADVAEADATMDAAPAEAAPVAVAPAAAPVVATPAATPVVVAPVVTTPAATTTAAPAYAPVPVQAYGYATDPLGAAGAGPLPMAGAGAGGVAPAYAPVPVQAVAVAGNSAPVQASMKVKQWDPASPYLKTMEKSEDPYAAYLAIRGEYDKSPSFYLECAEFFQKKGESVKAIRILSNLAEMDLEAPQILRVLGYRLLQYENPADAVPVLETVLTMRPEEPQSYRDLAIALTRRAESVPDTAKADYTRALDLYQTLIWGRDFNQWDGRFREIELFALEESNAMLASAKQAGVTEIPLDKEFIRPVDVDVRIVMTWSADNTDIDLWVIEPSGEKVYYSHNRSMIGGMISRDYTVGYGPEEYMIHNAMPGKYQIKSHYYGSHSVEVLGAVTVQADVYTNYGRPNQKRQSLTFPLKNARNDIYDIGEITFEK